MNKVELKKAELEILSEDIIQFEDELKMLKKTTSDKDWNQKTKIQDLENKIKDYELEIKKWKPIIENIEKLELEMKKLERKNQKLDQKEEAIKNELKKWNSILNNSDLE